MKHYTDSLFLKILNMLSELLLAVLVYVIANFIRMHMSGSILKPYNMVNAKLYIPFVLMMGIYYVTIYFILGDYKTLHYRSFAWELKRVVTVNIVGAFFGASVMFFLQDKTMSRGLLILYTGIAIILFLIKRVLCSTLANRYVLSKGKYKVIVVGDSDNIIRYAKELMVGREERYEYVGFIADNDTESLPNYLGDIDSINSILDAKECHQLVLSEAGLSMDRLDSIVNYCVNKDIEVQLIPLFSDYFDAKRGMIQSREGTKLIPLSAKQVTNILGVNIAVTNIDEVIDKISRNINKWRGEYICVSNVHTTVMSYEDEEYCKVQNGAIMALPDGGPLSSYSRSQGISNAERVTGPDLMKKILSMSSKHGWRHVFYGSSEETLKKLKLTIDEKYPGTEIAGMISPPYRELSEEEEQAYAEQINEMKPDFVWVGLGAPKQELWMARQKGKICAVMIGVGAAFDYESGNIKRAPKWMQKCSLEWLYRLLQDPKRLFKRYFVTNIKYMWLTRR